MKNRTRLIIVTIIFVFIIALTVGFSTFNAELMVSNVIAYVRADKNIRVTNVTSTTNSGAVSNYNDYSVSNILDSVVLPNNDSTITYEIEITNIGNVEMAISNIDTSRLSPNLTITNISGYNLKDKLCDDIDNTKCTLGAVKKIYVTVGYSNYDGNTLNYNIDLGLEFKQVFNVQYRNIINNGYPTVVVEGENLNVTFVNDIPYDVLIDSRFQYTYNNPVLTVQGINDNITIDRYYSITYELNGGNNSSSNPSKYLNSDSINISNPTYGENIFVGWYTNSSFSGSVITNTNQLSGDTTLYAKWISEAVRYNITYVLNGGTNPSGQVTSFIPTLSNTILEPTKNYYIFSGWYTNSSFSGSAITNTNQLSDNTTLYAKWEEIGINISYDSATNTVTATNITSPVALTSFAGTDGYEYTMLNTSGSTINNVTVTLSYTNGTGNTSSTMTCELYLNDSPTAIATGTGTLTAKKTSGTVVLNWSSSYQITENDKFTIKFTNTSLTNGTVEGVTFKFS